MNIVAIVAAALISAALITLLRKNLPEFALPISVVSCAIILLVIITAVGEVAGTVNEIARRANIDDGNIRILFKSLGVCYITSIGKDACKDCGETALANKVDLAGKIVIAVLSLPLILQVLSIITELVS